MSLSNSGDSARRYSDICGATNNRDEPCKLPAGWGTPGSGGRRCRFHGGCSTGPSDTSQLEGNDFAEGNPGGGAPKGNTNAEIHGGFSDWQKAYDRLDDATKAYVDLLTADMRKRAKEHAPDVPPDRREELLREYATRFILGTRADNDVFVSMDGSGEGRGFEIEADTVEHDGETYTLMKLNPALEASYRQSARQRQIANELRLYPGDRSD